MLIQSFLVFEYYPSLCTLVPKPEILQKVLHYIKTEKLVRGGITIVSLLMAV